MTTKSIDQNNLERIKDRMQKGDLTVDRANVEMVMIERVRLITSRVPNSVRKALNAAVKTGELGHIKKDGHRPEAYFNPTFEYLVPGERNEYERKIMRAIIGVCI